MLKWIKVYSALSFLNQEV